MKVTKKQLTIAIVDDHNLFSKGLIKLIHLGDTDNRYTILFEAENGLTLQEKLQKNLLPDIIVMDIDMPDMNGFEAADWLRKYHPDISILIVSMFESEEAILRMLHLGVKGYLSKDIEVEDMHLALEALAEKRYYYSALVSGVMAQALLKNTGRDGTSGNPGANLSEKEREFIKLACTEMTYQQIADRMHLSPKTIDGYRETLFLKFEVKNRVGLAMFAVKHGMVKL